MPSSGKTEGEDGLHLLVVLDGLCRGVVTASTSSGKLSCGDVVTEVHGSWLISTRGHGVYPGSAPLIRGKDLLPACSLFLWT